MLTHQQIAAHKKNLWEVGRGHKLEQVLGKNSADTNRKKQIELAKINLAKLLDRTLEQTEVVVLPKIGANDLNINPMPMDFNRSFAVGKKPEVKRVNRVFPNEKSPEEAKH